MRWINLLKSHLHLQTEMSVNYDFWVTCITQSQVVDNKMEKRNTTSSWLTGSACYRVGDLEQSLLKAQAELDTLREQRVQHVKMAEAIVKQRDTYRVLLAQATAVNLPPQGNRHQVGKRKRRAGNSASSHGQFAKEFFY